MKSEKGFTLIEMVVVLAITGILVTVVAAAIPMALAWAPRQANELSVEEDLSFARYWLTRDANAAETFIPLSAPQYGTLRWSDFSGASMVSYNVTYSYDSATTSLIREEWQDNILQSSLPIARQILSQNATQFTWSAGTRKLSTNITATIVDAEGVGTNSRTATVVTTLRPAAETTVSPPSDVPIPPPPPGSEVYYISANPTIVYGSLVSGNFTSLHDSDSIYYAVSSSSGSPKRAAWSGQSEVMTTPATISEIQVRFVGKANQNNITMEFFVQDSAAGFPATATSGFTFTEADTVTTRFFYLDATALAYVNSLPQKRVNLKVQGSGSANFNLYTDQILFTAGP